MIRHLFSAKPKTPKEAPAKPTNTSVLARVLDAVTSPADLDSQIRRTFSVIQTVAHIKKEGGEITIYLRPKFVDKFDKACEAAGIANFLRVRSLSDTFRKDKEYFLTIRHVWNT